MSIKRIMQKVSKLYLSCIIAFGVLLSAWSNIAVAEDNFFSDVPSDSWYAEAVKYYYDNNLLDQSSDGLFHPEHRMTRAEFAMMLAVFFGIPKPSQNSSFNDVNDQPYAEAVTALFEAGLVKGYTDGTFRPDEPINRAEAAYLLAQASSLSAQPEFTEQFTDIPANSWYAGAIGALTNFRVVSGQSSNTYAPNLAVTKAEAISLFFRTQYRTFKIDDISGGKIIISGKAYEAAKDLQGLFDESNLPALKNAQINFIPYGNEIVSVTALEIDKGAELEDKKELRILDGHGSSIKGSVIVNSDYFALANLGISQQLILTPNVNKQFYAYNVHVAEKTVYLNQADGVAAEQAQMIIKNSSFGEMQLFRSVHILEIGSVPSESVGISKKEKNKVRILSVPNSMVDDANIFYISYFNAPPPNLKDFLDHEPIAASAIDPSITKFDKIVIVGGSFSKSESVSKTILPSDKAVPPSSMEAMLSALNTTSLSGLPNVTSAKIQTLGNAANDWSSAALQFPKLEPDPQKRTIPIPISVTLNLLKENIDVTISGTVKLASEMKTELFNNVTILGSENVTLDVNKINNLVIPKNSQPKITLGTTANITNLRSENSIALTELFQGNSDLQKIKLINGSTNDTLIVPKTNTVPVPDTLSTSNQGNQTPAPSRSLSYSGSLFQEAAANDGTVGTTAVNIILSGDSFTGADGNDFVAAGKINVTNLPNGLAASILRTSSTQLMVLLTGSASSHSNANDIANLTFTFQDSAFTGSNASGVTNYNKNNLSVNFMDPTTISATPATLTEAAADNGTLTNGAVAVTVANGTFASDIAKANVTLSGLPAGFDYTVGYVNSSEITVTVIGTANLHSSSNDTSFTITVAQTKVTGTSSPLITGSVAIVFNPPRSLSYSGSLFQEAAANNGTVGTTFNITLSGDSFTGANNDDFVSVSKIIVTNLPNGLTASILRTSSTQLTVSLTGSASSHSNANDIANLTFTFQNSAFTGSNASGVTNYIKNNLSINFMDPTTISASPTTLTEAAADNGTLTNGAVAVTVANGTFASDIAKANVTLSGLPAGLDYTVDYVSSSEITVTVTGAANLHLNSNDTSFTITVSQTKVTGTSSPLNTGSVAIDFTNETVSPQLASIQYVNNDTANSIKTGDQIIISFNEAIDPTSINTNLTSGGIINFNNSGTPQMNLTAGSSSGSNTLLLNGTHSASWNLGGFTIQGNVFNETGNINIASIGLNGAGTVLTLTFGYVDYITTNAAFDSGGGGFTYSSNDDIGDIYILFTASSTIKDLAGNSMDQNNNHDKASAPAGSTHF